MKKLIIIFLLLFIGCSTVQYKNESFEQTRTEIEDIIKHDKNLTDAQKIVLKHAIVNLKSAQAVNKQNDKLTKEIISTSKTAGAGRLIYVILGVICLISICYIIGKVSKVLPF